MFAREFWRDTKRHDEIWAVEICDGRVSLNAQGRFRDEYHGRPDKLLDRRVSALPL